MEIRIPSSTLTFLILLTSFYSVSSFGQSTLKNYESGYYVTAKGDTIPGFIKKISLAESCVKIKFRKNSSSKTLVLYPPNVIFYKRGNQSFVMKELDAYGSVNFVEPVIVGELSLYTKWVAKNNGYSTFEIEKSYIELNGKDILKVSKTNFSKKMASYLSDNGELSHKIL